MERMYCPYQLQSRLQPEVGRLSWCTHCIFRRRNSLLSFAHPEGLPCERWMSRSSLQGDGLTFAVENDLVCEELAVAAHMTRQVGPAYLTPPL